jgi:putative SOS response-associated peptidase YedK
VGARRDGERELTEAVRARRAIVPASHFFEWAGSGPDKVPYVFRLKDGGLFGFAGLWFEGGGEAKFVIVTTSPNELTRPVHDRMPAMLLPEHEDLWLDPDQEAGRLTSLLGPYPDAEMEAYPVSARVNSPANDSADLLDPVPARDAATAAASAGPNPL